MAIDKKNDTFIKKDSLKELVEKYKSKDIVSSFEKNINFTNIKKVNISSLNLYCLFNEKNYSDKSLELLARSVRTNGFMFPIFVYMFENKMCVINGVKRFLVAKKLHYQELQAVFIEGKIEDINDYIINNMIINNDNMLILAYAYNILYKKFDFKEANIKSITGLSHGQINNTLRLLKLSKDVKKMVIDDKLTYAKARLLVIFDADKQNEIAKYFVSSNMSVRECETYVRNMSENSIDIIDDNSKPSYEYSNNKLIIHQVSREDAERIINLLKENKIIC